MDNQTVAPTDVHPIVKSQREFILMALLLPPFSGPLPTSSRVPHKT
jgi:hypothetical protein